MAQSADDIVWSEIERNCREWAALDAIEPGEMDQYLSECRRLEAEQYGLSEETQVGDDAEASLSTPGVNEQD
jgi:hypothetical protein